MEKKEKKASFSSIRTTPKLHGCRQGTEDDDGTLIARTGMTACVAAANANKKKKEQKKKKKKKTVHQMGLCLDVVVVVGGALGGVEGMLAAVQGLVEDHPFGAMGHEAQVHDALDVQVAVAGVPVLAVRLARTEGGSGYRLV